MTTLTATWAQHLDPKNFSQYTIEALTSKAEAGVLTREAAALLDMAQRSIVRHWVHDSEKTAGIIEKHEAALCVKLLVNMYMPNLLLRNYEAFASCILKEDRESFARFSLSSVCRASEVTPGFVKEREGAFEHYVSRELDYFADAVYRLLKNQHAQKHRLKLGPGNWYYSPDLRNQFLALTSFALTRAYKHYFITVYLSDEESDRLIKSPSGRSLQQKLTRHLTAILGAGDFAGTVVIEPSPSKAENFHIHMVIVTREIDQDMEARLRDQLRKLTEPNMKSAINIKSYRNLKRLKRIHELLNVHDDILTKQELQGIDIGLMDYLSKDLTPDLKIGIHKQVFSLNNELFFKNKMRSTLQEFMTFLFDRTAKHIQISNKQAALSEIKRCILSLIVNLNSG